MLSPRNRPKVQDPASRRWNVARVGGFTTLAVALLMAAPPLAASLDAPLVATPPWGAWVRQTVETTSATTASESSLALDATGRAHFLHQASDENGIRNAFYYRPTETAWARESVAMATPLALAVDSRGAVYAMHDGCPAGGGACRVTLAIRANGTWTQEGVDAVPAFEGVVLVDEARDRIHLVYDANTQGLTHAVRALSGGTWTVDVIHPGGGNGRYNDAALDSLGRVHVAYGTPGGTDGWLWYAAQSESGWTVQNVATRCGSAAALALDAMDQPHLACNDGRHGLSYWRRVDTAWRSEVISGCINCGQHPTIAVDDRGTVHLVYWDLRSATALSPQQITYASRGPDGRWAKEAIDPTSQRDGGMPDLVLDEEGRPHVAFVRVRQWTSVVPPGGPLNPWFALIYATPASAASAMALRALPPLP